MSRIGKKAISVPSDVTVDVEGQSISVKSKTAQLSLVAHPLVVVAYDTQSRLLTVTRAADDRLSRSVHGLTRALIANMVSGVVKPWEKRLEIQGVGYQAVIANKTVVLTVGFANQVKLPIPVGVICELPDSTHVIVKSADRQAAGQFAADIRAVRPPEPYKGKGIRYADERVRRKQGKAFGS